MAFCSQCGTSLPADARFCPKCGTAAPSGPDSASDVPPTAFAATAQPGAAPQPQPIPAQPARGRGGPGWILPVMIVVALAVIGALLWSQREGARPIADNAEMAAETEAPDGAAPKTDATEMENGEKAGNGKSTGSGAAPDETVQGDGGAERAADEGGSVRTTAASLDSAFNANPQGARARYAGPVSVSAVIATMVNPGRTPSLSLEGRTRLNFVVANLRSDGADALAELRKGDRVTLACSGADAIAGTTILQGCALE